MSDHNPYGLPRDFTVILLVTFSLIGVLATVLAVMAGVQWLMQHVRFI